MAQRTQGAITAASHPFLASELDAATREIRDACGWHIAPVKSLTYTHNGPTPRRVFLPAMKIAAISDVTADGSAVDLAGVEFDENTGWTNIVACKVTVTFSAGFAEVPSNLVTLALQMAARALGSPMGATREQTLVSSVSWTTVAPGVSGGEAILDHERASLSAYKLGPIP
jgi:hypothetical protein